jgi:histidyl-tRNA synthetase
MKRADRSGARLALILGQDELSRGSVALKLLREHAEQIELSLEGLLPELRRLLRPDLTAS